MKSKIVSGSALAAAAVALALSGGVVAPAYAKGHVCDMSKGQCGGKTKCMTKHGVCKHYKSHCSHHKGSCHHKAACHQKSKCKTK